MSTESNTLVFKICGLVILIFMVCLMATDIYLPSLPSVANTLHASNKLVQLSLTVFLISFGVAQLIFGPLSDYYGRRPILLLGLGTYLLGSTVCMLANNIDTLLIGRFIQGMGAAAGMVLGRVILREVFTQETIARLIAYISMTVLLTPAFAPVLGGYIQSLVGFRGNFAFLLIFCSLVLFAVYFLLPETLKTQEKSPANIATVVGNFMTVVKSLSFLRHVFVAGLSLAAIIAYSAVNPFLLQNELEFSVRAYTGLTFIVAFFTIMGSYLNSRMIKILEPHKIIILGLTMITFAGILMLLFFESGYFNVYTIVIPACIAALFSMFIMSNALSRALYEFKENIGTASAVFGCLQLLIVSSISYLIAVLPENTPFSLSWVLIMIGTLGLLSFIKNPVPFKFKRHQ